MSKYKLHEDFADIPDSRKGAESKLLLAVGNSMLRAQTRKVKPDPARVTETHRKIPGYNGDMIGIRIYAPANVKEELPCIVYFHGGAWVGELMPHQVNYAIVFAERVPCKVVVVEYRLALRHPFPTGVEDCYAALQWVFENAGELGIDPSRIAVHGDSSGGNFAAAVCLMARDRKAHDPCYQMLLYPVVDVTCSTESGRSCVDTPELNSYGIDYAWRLHLAKGYHGMPQYASPLFASDHSGLPDAYVETAEFDPLHDEGIAYAEKLEKAGVKVELNETTGTYHGFDIKYERPFSQRALAHRVEVFQRVFHKA